jgi:hypothetical protein
LSNLQNAYESKERESSSTLSEFDNTTMYSRDQIAVTGSGYMKGIQKTRKWTPRDDEHLRRSVARFGRKWTIIAEDVGRSPEDCAYRYDFRLDWQPRHGSWSKEEDTQLVSLVKQYAPVYWEHRVAPRGAIENPVDGTDGAKNLALGDKTSITVEIPEVPWASIGKQIRRTGQQCSIRFRLTLDPRLKWRLWMADEDKQLVTLREELGYTYAMISAVMDRASPSCRYRYLKLKAEASEKTCDDKKDAQELEGGNQRTLGPEHQTPHDQSHGDDASPPGAENSRRQLKLQERIREGF